MKLKTILLGLSALFVAANAAFFSVSGLSKLFAGASLAVIFMASSLELAKLVTAGYLYNYWSSINKVFRVYLTIGTLILVLITSLGIYGFLTAAFQETFSVFSVTEKQKSFLKQKEEVWEKDVARYDTELNRISDNISTLSKAKTSTIQVRDTSTASGYRTTVSTSEIRLAQKRITTEEENRNKVQEKRDVAADSLQSIQIKLLDLETDTEISAELGPLQYLSGLLDKPMDKIINWFILIIIFVFDPLAIALVVAFNNAVKVDREERNNSKISKPLEVYGDLYEGDNEKVNTIYEDDKEEVDTIDEEEPNPVKEFLDENGDSEIKKKYEDLPIKDITDDNDLVKEDIKPKEVVNKFNTKSEFDKLKKDTSRRGIDLDGDGIIDGYDTNGDGLIDEYTPSSSKRANYTLNEVPFYARPNFNWGDTKKWINNQNAVNYWLTHIKNNQDKRKYPDNFDSKTY